MKYIFSALGGGGSTYLVRSLARRYDVGNKPDTVFRPDYRELRIGTVNVKQGVLEERTGGYLPPQRASLEAFLTQYLEFLRASPRRTAVFNTCAELGLFSKYHVEGVVFLVRHPLHSYVSWAKPERHGDAVQH